MSRCIFALFLLFFYVGYTQVYSVSGVVKDSGGTAIEYANLLLLDAADSTMVKGTSTSDKGNFIFEKVEPRAYILKISYLGYVTKYVPIDVNRNLDLGELVIDEGVEDLKDVTLAYRKPTLEKKADRIVFNVENTSISQSSGLEILKNTPSVLLVNGTLLVKNAPAVIYINDRRVFLSGDELENLMTNYSGTNIKSVEVITNPPARYDAEGGAIINIVTSKNISIGYKGSVNTRATNAVFPKYSVGTEHFYKTNHINLFAGYSYNQSKDFKRDLSFINFFDSNTPSDRWENNFERVTRTYAHNLNTIVDFTLNEKNSLSLSATLLYTPDQTYNNNAITNIFNASGALDSYFTTLSDVENDNVNALLNLDYTLKLGDKGATLKSNTNYIYYDDEQFQGITTEYFNSSDLPTQNNNFNSLAKQENHIVTSQVDISTPWGTTVFDTGLKFSSINSKSSVNFGGSDLPQGAVTDNFEYNENIYAAYTSLAKDWEKWSLVLGLRGEYTDVKANSIALGQVNTQTYTELFPNATIQFNEDDNHQYSINYKRGIQRPRYQSLNPYRYFLNENQFDAGNPELTRAIENKVSFDFTYKGAYIFSVYYQHFNNNLEQLTFQDNENRLLLTSDFNIDQTFQYSLDFTYYSYVKDWWFVSTYMSAFYLQNNFTGLFSGNTDEQNNTNGYFAQLFNQYTLSQKGSLYFDASAYYLSNFVFGSFDYKNQFGLDLGLTKTFANKRATATLNVTDVFNTMNIPLTSRYANQDNGFFSKPESRTVSLAIRYKFGNFRLNDNNRETKPAEQERFQKKKSFRP